jgi:hypothetical protein
VWIQHFAVDKEAGLGKTDFGFKLRLSEAPTFALREWLRNDLFLNLWETRPKLIEKRNEETFDLVKEVVLDPATNIPVIETKQRGILRVTLSDWLNKPEFKPEEAQYQHKVAFFDTSLQAVPEFVYANNYVHLKESERVILLEHLAQVEEEAKQ